jgi:hypothetical protein
MMNCLPKNRYVLAAKISILMLMGGALSTSAAEQVVTPASTPLAISAGASASVDLLYSTSNPENANSRGLNLRIHYDSSKISHLTLDNVFTTGSIGVSEPTDDSDDYDNDATTDKIIIASWIDISQTWPGKQNTVLGELAMTIKTDFNGATFVRFSGGSTGFEFSAHPIEIIDYVDLAPVISAPEYLLIELNQGNAVTVTDSRIMSYLSGATAMDTEDGELVVTYEAPNSFVLGQTLVTFLTTDSFGNVVNVQGSVTVTSLDNDADGYSNIDETDNASDPDLASSLPADNDGDFVSDINDANDDNDGIPDSYELANGLDPVNALDALLDFDSDGLSNYDEFRLGTDIRNADTDGDGLADNVDNNPLVFDEVAPTLYSGQLTVLPDMNDDGIADIGILKVDSDAGQVTLDVLSGNGQSLLNTLTWVDTFEDSTLTLHVIPDMNDNGVDDLGLFGVQDAVNKEGRPQMFVRDLQTGARVSVYNWPANWKEVSAMVLSDISGDGIAEIGLQGRFKDGNRPQLVVKNGADGSNQGVYAYPNLFVSPMFYQHSDVDGDGFEEIATFGRIKRNNKIQIKIASGINPANKMKAYNFPDNWSDISWVRLDDSNGDGIDDWGLFGISQADGRPQLINKDGTDPKGALRLYAWTADLSAPQFLTIPDMNNDGVDEVAVAGLRSNGRTQLQVKDGVDRNSVLANHNLNLKLESVTYHVLPDLSGDEQAEIGFMGINPQGDYELVIRHGDTLNGEYASYNLGNDWDSAPSITSLGDTDDDDLPDLLIYGQQGTGQTLSIMAL